MGKKNKDFNRSATDNKRDYLVYLDRIRELSMSMFEWKNLPDTIDKRFLELKLFEDGMAVFFKEPVIGYLALPVAIGGPMNVYNIPTYRRAYATNGFQQTLSPDDSVIIFNNLIHTNSINECMVFAKRLYEIDMAIGVNIKAQKTPILITCEQEERLTLENLYMKYDGNMPVIYGNKTLSSQPLKAINTGAPFVAKDLYEIKTQTWNEILTYLGISNTNFQKKERLITDEVTRNMGGTIASRYSRLEARRQACNKINEMFDLDIWCDYREDFQVIEEKDLIVGEPDSEGQGGSTEEGGAEE